MNSLKRRTTYQYGTLMPELRKRGPNVWTYRFSERNNDKRVRRKVIVGTLDDLPTRADAERASEHLRLAANREVRFDRKTTMRGLVGRYVEEVLKPCLDVPWGEYRTNRRKCPIVARNPTKGSLEDMFLLDGRNTT